MTEQEIADASSCFTCMTPEQLQASQVYLLEQIRAGGGSAWPYVLRAGDTSTGLQIFSAGARISSGQTLDWNNDLFLRRVGAASIALGAVDSASPVAQTINFQGVAAGNSNVAGQNATFNGSRGTGTGIGGAFLFYTAPAGSSGSSQNALALNLQIRQSGGIQIGSLGGAAPALLPFSGTAYTTPVISGNGLVLYSFDNTSDSAGFAMSGNTATQTSGTYRGFIFSRAFSPTSGTGVYNQLEIAGTINQTGGANGITRGILINQTLSSAADYRALEIVDGNVLLPKTVTSAGTTGARTINKVTGTVNFAAAATSLVVTNSYVTANSIIIATVATNDTTMKSVQAVAGAGSFTLYANAAATAETRVNFHVTN